MVQSVSILDFGEASKPDVGEELMRKVFAERSAAAVAQMARQAPIEEIADALAAPTSFGTLARALSSPGAVGAAINEIDPFTPLYARHAQHRIELLQEAGGVLSVEEVAAILHISRQAVDKRRRASQLLAVRLGNDWRYPVCQFDQGTQALVPGLREVIDGMAELGPWTTLDFLLAPDTSLEGLSPLEALRRGGAWLDRVRRQLRIERIDNPG